MQSVMISIQPVWVEKILNGEKTIDMRKSKPKLRVPFKCYIYCTQTKRNFSIVKNSDVVRYQKHCNRNGKVVAEFTCNKINLVECDSEQHNSCLKSSCLTLSEILEYCNGQDLYAWHISSLVVYDKPKELSEFLKPCISPEYPYCPSCKVGYESISESEQEAYRAFGECNTEWNCLNYIKRPPQSWCYVEELR